MHPELFGWFGGHGLEGTGEYFESLGLRPGRRQALAAGTAEACNGVLLTVGALTLAGTVMSATMVTAIRRPARARPMDHPGRLRVRVGRRRADPTDEGPQTRGRPDCRRARDVLPLGPPEQTRTRWRPHSPTCSRGRCCDERTRRGHRNTTAGALIAAGLERERRAHRGNAHSRAAARHREEQLPTRWRSLRLLTTRAVHV